MSDISNIEMYPDDDADIEMHEDSLWGDAWFEGFLAARKIAKSDNQFDQLEDYTNDDVLRLSEHAEADRAGKHRTRWTKNVPTKQGVYWHWSGSHDDAPLVVYVMYSGTKKECFVSAGQLGLTKAVYCSEYGGLWANCIPPKLPES